MIIEFDVQMTDFQFTLQKPLPMRSPHDILQQVFGHDSFRGQQQTIIERVLNEQHCLVIMPTGMGKSLCYQIPALVWADSKSEPRPLTLVISPLIALMKDQVDALIDKSVDATFINSSLPARERESRYANIAAGNYDLLYVTPERFRKQDFCDVLKQRDIKLLAIDEAHCISEWGHDFRPDYTRVGEIRQQLGSPATIALTATATPEVQSDIIRQLNLTRDEVQFFHAGIDRPNLSLEVIQTWDDDAKLDQIVQTRQLIEGSGIVYFTLIRTLTEFSDRLWHLKIPHLIYHGDLPRAQRRDLQESFMNEDGHLVLATNAFGMGIDKEDIRYVLHADLPGSLESYYQEIGRAGRDGNPSQCLLMYDERDLATQMEFIGWSNPDAQYYQRVYELLQKEAEQIQAFGIEWLREKLHAKQKHDHRLETALAMLERWNVIEGTLNPLNVRVVSELPGQLSDAARLDQKRDRDQRKLLAMLQYVKHDGDRKQFINEYFGIE